MHLGTARSTEQRAHQWSQPPCRERRDAPSCARRRICASRRPRTHKGRCGRPLMRWQTMRPAPMLGHDIGSRLWQSRAWSPTSGPHRTGRATCASVPAHPHQPTHPPCLQRPHPTPWRRGAQMQMHLASSFAQSCWRSRMTECRGLRSSAMGWRKRSRHQT